MSKMNVVVFPVDGSADVDDFKRILAKGMANPLAAELIAEIKLNDALHIPGVGPNIINEVRKIAPDVKIFIDLKLPDVSATNINILKRYAPYNPDIVTVTSIVSAASLLAIREKLPEIKIALVDTLTDISEEELKDRYGMSAAAKITKALEFFERRLGDKNPIDYVVCAPTDVKKLGERFGNRYKYINPGIRSPHMAKDHQERITSAYEALINGADLLVMGAQLSKGNPDHPDRPVSAEESVQITFDEVVKAKSDLGID